MLEKILLELCFLKGSYSCESWKKLIFQSKLKKNRNKQLFKIGWKNKIIDGLPCAQFLD